MPRVGPAERSPTKWIANYDNQFKGPIPVREALAESRIIACVTDASGGVVLCEASRTTLKIGTDGFDSAELTGAPREGSHVET